MGELFLWWMKETDGTVTANGKGGSGLWLDFGANPLGTASEYRGSYMRYKKKVGDDGSVTGYNIGLLEMTHPNDDYSFTDLTGGDLNDKMATINVTGTIEGRDGGAIYMAEEAFVDNINFNQGAQIKGDIINKWKDFDESTGIYASDSYETRTHPRAGYNYYVGGLMLQYDGKMIPYNKYVPGLVTNLNFNADMDYTGNITGSENTKMKVNNGTLRFGGSADVVNVEVAKGASLFGGTFTVNDMSAKMAEGYADSTTGQLISHGTIGAATQNTTMAINGALVSDGVLRAYGGGKAGQISVTGNAVKKGAHDKDVSAVMELRRVW